MRSFLRAFGSAFSFFLFAARKNRRSRTFFLVSLLPAVAAAVIALGRLFLPEAGIDGPSAFGGVIMGFELQFLVLVLALFYGTSICSEEVEGRTLTYLTTRPVPKQALLLGKFAAVVLMLVVFLVSGLVLAFLPLHAGNLGDGAAWLRMVRSAGVLALGLLCYTAFFTLAGTFLKKSVLFGLFFAFGWESVVQYFPGATQKLTVMHYLKSLLPVGTTGGGKFDFLIFRLEPSPPAAAVAVLIGLTAVFLAAAAVVFAGREYLFEE
jgi:ABC-type transport system involved in multi-copper enzyme maturation permease subunit